MESKNENKKKRKNTLENNPNIYIKINSKSNLELEVDDDMSQMLMECVNSIVVENIGKEINKFFIKILPENKENDPLKFNYALSYKIQKKLNLNKIQIKTKCEEYMNQIINMKIDTSSPFFLTKEINEKLAFVLMVIFRNIKKNGKFVDYDEVIKCILKSANFQNGILDNLQNKNELNPYSYMYSNDSYIDDNDIYDTGKKTVAGFFLENSNIDIEPMRMTLPIQPKKSDLMTLNENNYKTFYNIKAPQIENESRIPFEVFILREKFENIKIIKLSIKQLNMLNNDLILLDQNDIIHNIFVLINLKLLFQNLMGVELDLSNELILRDEIIEINPKYEKVLKKAKKNKKLTFYKTENKIRVYDVYKSKHLLSSINKNTTEDIESSDNFSTFISNNIIDEKKKSQEKFLNKHMYSLQMIIIYWYFITKLNDIRICNFTIPINFEDKIITMLKENKTTVFEFNIFANLTDKLSEVTLDFNSLDNKLFLQIISFLFKNIQLTKCHISLFPPEEYFEPRHLFYLLSQSSKSTIYKKEMNSSEEIDTFILRKLSENFEINIKKLFLYFLNMPKLREISLLLDIPSIITKVSNYELILIKLIINIFISINHTPKTFKKLTIISEALYFDNRKYPFLSDFLDNVNIFQEESSQIESLTLKFKIYSLHNFYRIIPYNVTFLSLGSFDLFSFQYFVEYITSSEFSIHSQIKYLQIALSNSILEMDDECFNSLEQLLTYPPKNLEEISINTFLYVTSEQIGLLLKNTNYNKIQRIQFNYNNNENKMYKTPKKESNEESVENIMDLYYIKTDDEVYEKFKNKTLNVMYHVGNKYNKDFMDFNIFSQMEKFLCNKGKKTIIFQ